eukprot:CAMPEP_0115313966 /NCGR_PEP_ID=MMETSP0270-20121206/76768_1 /TAXON_ID=71861 /ORGANISM="Scrippsiella trochoidea, Strain CCMP3099" /LENGTH=124 /DNA_ID=CAMNT_0002733135 /DNA_START=490 /DNA_END=864 /DNA_ORIENTATION=-
MAARTTRSYVVRVRGELHRGGSDTVAVRCPHDGRWRAATNRGVDQTQSTVGASNRRKRRALLWAAANAEISHARTCWQHYLILQLTATHGNKGNTVPDAEASRQGQRDPKVQRVPAESHGSASL